MATILQSGTAATALDLDEYNVQAALDEETALWSNIANQSIRSVSGTDQRLDIYLTGGGHMIFVGSGFSQNSTNATITSFSYTEPLGVEIGFNGNFGVDAQSGSFLGGSLTSFWLTAPHLSVDLQGSMQLDAMENFSGDISLLEIEALGVGVTLNGHLHLAADGSLTGDIVQIRFDWGGGQFTEFQNINLSFNDLDGYQSFQQLYADMAALDNTIYGSSGNDTLIGGSGNNTIIGGNGTDTLVIGGIVSQYEIDQNNGYTCLAGPQGTDTLQEVEYLRFGSSAFATDVPLSDAMTDHPLHLAQQITDLYVAYFNRGPDTTGFDYWFHETYTGSKSLRTIAEDFAWSPEYRAVYPDSLTNRQFVEQIYMNLFDRSPDLLGWDYWSNRLDSGSLQRSGFILDAVAGAYAPTSGPEDRTLIDNKHDVALYYTGQLVTNPQEGFDSAIVDLLNRVTAEPSTALAAERVIDYTFENPMTLTGVMGNQTLFDSLWKAG